MASLFYKAASQKDGQIDALELFSTASAKARSDLIKETNEDQWNALHWAAHYGNIRLLADLIVANANAEPLLLAKTRIIICNVIKRIKINTNEPKQAFSDLNEVTREGFSAVYIAARTNNKEILQQLIDAKADLDLQDGHKQTALHRACENQFEEIAIMLITAGANVNLQDLMGRTALHWTCSKTLLKVGELLLEHNAAILKTQGNETPLHWAASCDSLPMIQLLLKFHPEINVYDKNDRDESALQMTNVQEIRDLLAAHAQSLGVEADKGDTKINNQSFGTSVKPVADNKSKTKKLTIKLKPK